MHPLSLLLLLLVISFSQNITPQEENRFEACIRPYRCGNIDVRYPFLIDDRPSYCGRPSLSLACEGNRPEIVVNTVRFQVMNISYSDGLITLVDEDVLNRDGCPTSSFYQPITNPILELTTGNGRLIVLLSGCPQRPDENYNHSMGSSNFSDMGFYEICPYVDNENSTYSDIGNENSTSSRPKNQVGAPRVIHVGLSSTSFQTMKVNIPSSSIYLLDSA